MEKNDIWNKFNFNDMSNKSALNYLNELKEGLAISTKGELRLDVESVDSYIEADSPKLAALYMLYVVAPKLGNFRRKILTVAEFRDTGRFPVDIVIHLKNNEKISNVKDSDFLKVINEILDSPIVKNSIENLFSQSKEYGNSIGLNLLTPNHTGVILLKNEKIMNYGVISIENNSLIHFTGLGLQKLFSPDLTTEEKDNAKKLVDEKNIEKLISLQYASITPIENIKRVIS